MFVGEEEGVDLWLANRMLALRALLVILASRVAGSDTPKLGYSLELLRYILMYK